MSTVPVFAPTGELGDIPASKLNDAVKAGFQPGVHVKSADGQDGVIPAHRTADAVKAGMKIVPIQDQPIQHEGFWSALGSDLGGMLQGMGPPISKEGLLAKAKMFKEAITGPDPNEYLQAAIDRMNAGYGPAYASAAGAAQQLGVNVPGMEQSAQQGDVGGVYGHAAAVPTAMATGAALSQLPLGRIARAGGSALQGGAERLPIVGPVAKGAIRGAVKSWRASAPDVEIPPSKVSTTPPESVSKSSQLQQSKALQNIPVAAVQDKSTILPRMQQIAQQIQAQGQPAPESYSRPLRVAGKEVPADTDLTSALQQSLPSKSGQLAQAKGTPSSSITEQIQAKWKESGFGEKIARQNKASNTQSLMERFPQQKSGMIEGQIPQARIQGKIMQVVRREGTLGMDRLMEAPELQGISRKQVEDAAVSLGNSKKLWVPTKEADAHGPAGIISLAIRKP